MHENMRLAYVCVSFAWSLVFSCLIFPILVCLFIFFIIIIIWMSMCTLMRERNKECVLGWIGKEFLGGVWGKRNFSQNTLYEKNLLSIIKDTYKRRKRPP